MSTVSHDIDIYARAILDLKSRLNALTPIGSLPPELLSGILVRGVLNDYHSSASASAYYYHRPPWIRLTHVCRHFRAVALSTPRFWSYLRLSKSQTFAELLARSKEAPLHVSGMVDDSSKRADRVLALDMPLPQSHRLKELRIDGPTKVVQSFCSKTVTPLDSLERLELTTPSDHYSSMSDYGIRLPAVVPILASAPPPRLRHLELRRLPFLWNDRIFSASTLTTLVVTGKNSRDSRSDSLPDVGTFEELFSALEAVAPRLEVLEIEDTIPKRGLVVTTPIQLPPPSRSIPLPSIKSIRLAGDAVYIAYLLNHILSPSTGSLHVREPLGSKELAQSIATHMSEKPPLLSLILASTGFEPLILTGGTHVGTSGDTILQVTFGSNSSHDPVTPVMHGSGALFSRVQELRIAGMFMSVKWAKVFTRFPSVRSLVVDEHPFGDFLPSAMTLNRLKDGRAYVTLPFLRVLHLSGFRFSIPADELEPFDDLLDLAIFCCNAGVPIDEIHLNACKYATEEKVERLKEVVVDVEWDEWEMESTTEEEEYDSDDDVGYSDDDYYGRHYYGFGF